MSEYLVYILLLVSITISISFSILFLSGWKMKVSMGLFILNGLLLTGFIYNFLGNPLPANVITQHLFQVKDAKIVWMGFVENKAIYLMLNVGKSEPVYVKLPWNKKNAERLQQLQREAGAKGEGGRPVGGDITADMPLSLETRPNNFKHRMPPRGAEIEKPRQENEMLRIQ